MAERIVKTGSNEQTALLFGNLDSNLHCLEEAFSVRISDRTGDGNVVISGEEPSVNDALSAVYYLLDVAKKEGEISEQKLLYAISSMKSGCKEELTSEQQKGECLCLTVKGKPIRAKTAGQKIYTDKIKNSTVVLGIGPAGTGKTFLAVAMAVTALKENRVSRIVLTRPAVEAGEKLGYLPGDLQTKIDPYLRPLYDALFEMMGQESFQKQMEKGVLEIAPLAYMRGRTLDDSFIILDEAQNTTEEQMKMFLTRLGINSKAVVTGDLTQTDLPKGQKSGLAQAVNILDGIDKDIQIHHFTERDVVRHKLVQKIILAYEKAKKNEKNG